MPGENEEIPSVRASLEAAVKEVEGSEGDEQEPARTGEQGDEGAAEGEEKPVKEGEEAPEEEEKPEGEIEEEPKDDEAPLDDAAQKIVTPEAKKVADEAAKKEAAAAASKTKPPVSLSPLERQEFAKASPLLQKAMLRREEQITKALNETVAARKAGEAFQRIVAPYEGMIRAEGSTPENAVTNLLRMSVAMRTGPLPHRVQLVANMIAQFLPRDEATMNMLDQHLEAAYKGAPAPGGGPNGGGGHDPRFDQFIADLRQRQTDKQTAQAEGLKKHYEEFAENHEYFHDVRPYMSALISAEAERGVVLDDETAYERACELHPEVAPIVKQQKAAAAASKGNPKLQRAKDAGSSVRAAPVGKAPARGSAQPASVADSIRQSIKQLEVKE